MLGILSLTLSGWALWLLWPTVSLLMVGLNYLLLGAQGFQKLGTQHSDTARRAGRLSVGATGLLAPYLAAAWLNSRLWTRKAQQPVQVGDNVWLGRFPDTGARQERGR